MSRDRNIIKHYNTLLYYGTLYKLDSGMDHKDKKYKLSLASRSKGRRYIFDIERTPYGRKKYTLCYCGKVFNNLQEVFNHCLEVVLS